MPAPAKAPMDRSATAAPAPKGWKAPMAGLLGLLIGAVTGYGAGRVSTGTPLNPLSGSGETRSGSYQQGYDAARKKIEDAHLFPPTPTEALKLTGAVKSVGTDSLTVNVALGTMNPLDEIKAPAERKVAVTKDTKLSRQAPKSPTEMQKDFEAFQKAVLEGALPSAPPSSFKTEPITLADIKAGDTVTLTAGHDILNEASFTATEIVLTGTAAVQPAIAPPPAFGTPPAAP